MYMNEKNKFYDKDTEYFLTTFITWLESEKTDI